MSGNGKRKFATFNTGVGANCGDNCSCSSSPSDSSEASSSGPDSGSSSGSPSGAESGTSGANGIDGLIRNAAKRVGIPMGNNADEGADDDADAPEEDEGGNADDDGEDTDDDSNADDVDDDGDGDEPAGNAFPDVPDVGVLTSSAESFDAAELYDVGVLTANDDGDSSVSWMYEGMDWDEYLHGADDGAGGADGDADEPEQSGNDGGGAPQFGTSPGAGANRLPPDSFGGDSSDGGDDGGFHAVGALTATANDGDDGGTSTPRSGTFAGRGVGGTGNARDDDDYPDVGALTATAEDDE